MYQSEKLPDKNNVKNTKCRKTEITNRAKEKKTPQFLKPGLIEQKKTLLCICLTQ